MIKSIQVHSFFSTNFSWFFAEIWYYKNVKQNLKSDLTQVENRKWRVERLI